MHRLVRIGLALGFAGLVGGTAPAVMAQAADVWVNPEFLGGGATTAPSAAGIPGGGYGYPGPDRYRLPFNKPGQDIVVLRPPGGTRPAPASAGGAPRLTAPSPAAPAATTASASAPRIPVIAPSPAAPAATTASAPAPAPRIPVIGPSAGPASPAPKPAAPAAPRVDLPVMPPPAPSTAPAPATASAVPPPAPLPVPAPATASATTTLSPPAPATASAAAPVAAPPRAPERVEAPSAAPAPPAAVAPPRAPASQVAAATTAPAGGMRILFDGKSENPDATAAERVRALAAGMAGNSDRVRISAYAAAEDETTDWARRTSLRRAMNIRQLLLDAGVQSFRVQVRALGTPSDDGPGNRVDLDVEKR